MSYTQGITVDRILLLLTCEDEMQWPRDGVLEAQAVPSLETKTKISAVCGESKSREK